MWERHKTADGTIYYHDAARNLTQWDEPEGFSEIGSSKDKAEECDFCEFSVEDGILFQIQTLGLFCKKKTSVGKDVYSKVICDEILPKITFLKDQLESGIGTDAVWITAMMTNDFALVEILLSLLDERVDKYLSGIAAQCLAHAGTLYPKLWIDFVSDSARLQVLFSKSAYLVRTINALNTTTKVATTKSAPYLGFDKRDIKDFNLEGLDQENDDKISGLEEEDVRTSILILLMLLVQMYICEISAVKSSIDPSGSTMEEIEQACRLNMAEVNSELHYASELNVELEVMSTVGRVMKLLCRALLLMLPSFSEDAYLLALKALAGINRQCPKSAYLNSTEIGKMCSILHFDSDAKVNISEASTRSTIENI